MKNKTCALLAVTAAMSLVASAYAADDASSAAEKGSVTYHNDGGYDASSSASHTDSAGTTTTSKDSANVDVDGKGHVTRKIKHHATKDPKGLGNKQTSDTEVKTEEKDNGGSSAEVTRSNTDAAGTNTSSKVIKDTDVGSKGNVTTTEKTTETVDPKGLMNKETSSHTTKTVNGQVVEDTSK